MKFPRWRRRKDELDEELRSHLEQATRERIERGESPEQAARAARREFGNVDLVRDVTRDTWGWSWLEQLVHDIRYGARQLRRSPSFTAVAVLTLALGIGANTAIFSYLNALFLERLPVAEPSRLVRIYETLRRRVGPRYDSVSFPNYVYYRDHNTSFSDLVAHYSGSPINLAVEGESKEINGAVVTANYFPMLGLRPHMGRFFHLDEDQVPGRNPVAVISFALWRRQFAADPEIVGKSIRLNGTMFDVVGVAPEGFYGVAFGSIATEVWIPSAMFRVGYRYCDVLTQADCHVVGLLARLKPGKTLADAQEEMQVLQQRIKAADPDLNARRGIEVYPAQGVSPYEREDSRGTALLLAVAVGLVLMIACANLTGLLLARNSARGKEISVRLALGASRGRLVRQFLTESLLLSALGGALGLLVAWWANDLVTAFYAFNDEGQREYFVVNLNSLAMFFTLGIALLSGAISGFVPAMQASRPNLLDELKDAGRQGSRRGSRLRDVLVVTQLALSIVLLVGAGLLVRSLRSIYRGPGFDPKPIVLLRLRPSLVAQSPAKARAFQAAIIERLQSTPGVLAASPAFYPPLPGWETNEAPVWLPGQEPELARRAAYNHIGPRYFETLGLSLLEGRDFDSRDAKNSPAVAIVNQALARSLWPGQSPIGQTLVMNRQPLQVVGLVRDFQYLNATQSPQPFVYTNYWQWPEIDTAPIDSRTHVRIAGNPRVLLDRIRREIAAVDPDVPISEERPLTEWMDHTFRPVRMIGTLLVGFGGLAIFLSGIGVYGVLAFSVTQRTREIAIRRALGARRSNVAALVLGHSAILGLIGAAIGLAAGLIATRLLVSLLYGVPRHDPVTFFGVILILLGIVVLASYLPAQRALRVDPAVALRYE